jgi:hypothetical protein
VVGSRGRRSLVQAGADVAALARVQNADEQTGNRRWQWCGRTGTLLNPKP